MYIREARSHESRTSRKTTRLLGTIIANSRNFSGNLEEMSCPLTQDLPNCMFWLFVPLLDVLTVSPDPEEAVG